MIPSVALARVLVKPVALILRWRGRLTILKIAALPIFSCVPTSTALIMCSLKVVLTMVVVKVCSTLTSELGSPRRWRGRAQPPRDVSGQCGALCRAKYIPQRRIPQHNMPSKRSQRRILSERTLGKDTQQKIFPNLIAGVRVLSFDYFGSPWAFENLFPKLDNHSAWGCI